MLQHADPQAADLAAELASQTQAQSVWWPVDVMPEQLAAALIPLWLGYGAVPAVSRLPSGVGRNVHSLPMSGLPAAST